MPHRRRANEVSLCYLQSGGTCAGRSKLENLHRQEDSLEPAPAGRTMNQTQSDFAFGMKEKNLIGILIMPSENLWPEFFQRTCLLLRFLDQLLGFSRLLDFIESKFDFSFEIKKLLNPFDITAFLKGSCEFSLL